MQINEIDLNVQKINRYIVGQLTVNKDDKTTQWERMHVKVKLDPFLPYPTYQI